MADPLNRQGSSKTAKMYDHAKADGVQISPGPFIGTVKANTDILRSGRLQVWIPELGGDPNDDRSWRSVAYSTPFYGVTPNQSSGDYQHSPHSYGMWFVPPDIGVDVICIFVNGDPARGYWIGCVPQWPSLHMLPAISAPVDGSTPAPVTDLYVDPLSSQSGASGDLANFAKAQRLVHKNQEASWTAQGILKDPDRGPGTSSAFRETPSSVFGISTPGQPLKEDAVLGVAGRKGGHTFVMDDGDYKGKNAQMRLRTAAGHMILMNDTTDFIYIINSKGTAWVELTSQGDINVFGQSTMNITAKAGFNLETDGGITMHAKQDINIKSDTNVNIEGKDINLKGSGSTKVTGAMSLHLKGKSTFVTGDTCLQFKSNGHLDARGLCITLNTVGVTPAMEAGSASAPKNMPTHEPFNRSTPKGGGAPSQNQTVNAATNGASENATATTTNPPNSNTGVANPQSQPSYGAAQGQTTSSGSYGATNNYGSGNIPISYGPMTNDVGPTTYNNGMQGSAAGQSSLFAQYIPQVSNPVATIANFATQSLLQNITHGTGSALDIGHNVNGQFTNQNYSVGELQNNPGNLQYSSADKFATGYANGLAVYTRPEDGIAALIALFDRYATATPITAIQLIANYLQSKDLTSNTVVNFARFVQNNSGIKPNDYVYLADPQTRITWVTVVIRQIQGRIIYTYDQVVTGCAASLGLSPSAFTKNIAPNAPWNNGSTPSGFVSPNSPTLQNGGGSLLGNIVDNVKNNLINRAIGAAGSVVGSLVNNALRGTSQNPTSNQQGSYGFVEVNPNQAASRQDAEKILGSGGSFADATSKVDAANPARVPQPTARPLDLGVNYGSLDPQQRAELRSQYIGTQAQTTDITAPGPTASQRVDAAQTNVAIAQANADAANAKYSSALETFGPNDPRTNAFKNDADAANNSVLTAQSQRDTIIATSPLLDKDTGDATGSLSAARQLQQQQDLAALNLSDPPNVDNTSGQYGRGLPSSGGPITTYSDANYTNLNSNPQIPGLEQVTYANTGQTVYVGKDSAGNSITIQPSTIAQLTDNGKNPDAITGWTAEGFKSYEDSLGATAAQTPVSTDVPDAVADYRAPSPGAVATNNYYSTIDAGDPYTTPNRDVEYTKESLPTFAQPQSQDAAPLTIGNPNSGQTGYSFVDNPVPLSNTGSGDPRVGEGTLSGGYNDPYTPPPSDSATPPSPPTASTTVTSRDRQDVITGTTPPPGGGGATGGSGTPQGSAATGPSAGSC
jgi:hypothetical protein